jgi:hypothetical protein
MQQRSKRPYPLWSGRFACARYLIKTPKCGIINVINILPPLRMAQKPSNHRYQRLAAGFAACAFALLGLMASLQHEANAVTASVIDTANVLTTYNVHP